MGVSAIEITINCLQSELHLFFRLYHHCKSHRITKETLLSRSIKNSFFFTSLTFDLTNMHRDQGVSSRIAPCYASWSEFSLFDEFTGWSKEQQALCTNCIVKSCWKVLKHIDFPRSPAAAPRLAPGKKIPRPKPRSNIRPPKHVLPACNFTMFSQRNFSTLKTCGLKIGVWRGWASTIPNQRYCCNERHCWWLKVRS